MFPTKIFYKFRIIFIFAAGVLSGGFLYSGLFNTSHQGSSRGLNVDDFRKYVTSNSSLHETDNQRQLFGNLRIPVDFKDSHLHHDDDSKARELFSRVKILVWVMTMGPNHETKAATVKMTWGKHCNKILFMSDTEDEGLPAIAIYTVPGRKHLTGKTMRSFDYLYKHYLDEYDWFMKADDDTYVVLENLRYMLSGEDPGKPLFFGHHFKTRVKQGYFSGGGGYVISREALRRFGRRNNDSCVDDGGAEDVMFGRCMETLGVVTGDSRDKLNRTRFHCFKPEAHIRGAYPGWYLHFDKYNGTSKGEESISDYAVTFHYVPMWDMHKLEFFLYHMRPYGITSGPQDLNKH